MSGQEDEEELTSVGEKKGENSEDDEQKAIASNLCFIEKISKNCEEHKQGLSCGN